MADLGAVAGTSRLAVEVRGLVERFRVAADRPPTLKERLSTFRRARYATFEALHGIDLEVRPGETVALIGRNGSGKSTLLKCLAGIYQPDEGSVAVHGRIASLLELGAGFHPDMTGRENIYLNGSILGFGREEMDGAFDDIVAFAGVGDFLDTPVRNFSSGMYVRLGFAIAVNVDPDVLLVDEVLSVGDASFQERSLARMRAFGQRGKTVVLVSHDLSAVQALCERGVVLEAGRVVYDGPVADAVERYEELVVGERPRRLDEVPAATEPEAPPPRSGDEGARVTDVVLEAAGRTVGIGAEGELPTGAAAELIVTFAASQEVQEAGGLSVGLTVRRPDLHHYVYETRTAWWGVYLPPPLPGAHATVTFALDLQLLTGSYEIDLLVANASTNAVHDRWPAALSFRVTSPEAEFGIAALGTRIGVANPHANWPEDLHAPPRADGGPRDHPLRAGSPTPGYEPGDARHEPPRAPARGEPALREV